MKRYCPEIGYQLVCELKSPELKNYHQKLTIASEKFNALIDGLTEEQFNWQPAPQKWSIAECIEHLNLTAELYFKCMVPVIMKAANKGPKATGPYGRGTFTGRLLLSALDPAKKRLIPAPKIFKPPPQRYPLKPTIDQFYRGQNHFKELLEKSDGIDLGRIRFGTPVSWLIRVSLDQAFAILSLHQLRHLDQAQRIRTLSE